MFSRNLTRSLATAIRPAGARGLSSVSTLNPNLYTAVSTSTGSRAAGTAETSDRSIKLMTGFPAEMGGAKSTTASNPEQLLGLAWSTCFLSALGAVHAQHSPDAKPLPKSTAVRANISIGKDAAEKLPGFLLAAELEVLKGPLVEAGLNDKAIEALVKGAHEVCPYSRATRGNIEVHVRVVDA